MQEKEVLTIHLGSVADGTPKEWGTEPWQSLQHRITQVAGACALPGAWHRPALNVDGWSVQVLGRRL